ncbi:MAG: zinc-ribbon domain-containing protein [Candidatus Heimdallarchaeota archaeon]|nr:zinc-ribbon domain-containing protein [Candidatus Heimdallarchaeota archaeon]MCK5158917.1 zinc-ribbon domain-containing protein [Candidatus Heimdallarchaeota archaeon]
MKYCPECGNKNQDDHTFCMNCGTALDQLEVKSIPTLKPQPAPHQPSAPVLVRRNFLIWWLLSMVASPLYMVYLYFNFEDMNNLELARPHKEGPSLVTNKNNIILYLVLSAFIPFFTFIVRYWKYDRFYNYLEFSSVKNQTMPMSGKKQLGISIAMMILLIIGSVLLNLIALPIVFNLMWLMGLFIGLGAACLIVGMVLSFYYIYTEYIWQKAMNERILMINPHAEEKTLF